MLHQADIDIQRQFISAAFDLGSHARARLATIPPVWFTDFASREARDAILADDTLDVLGYVHKLLADGKFEDRRDAVAQFPSGCMFLPAHIDHAADRIRESYVRHAVECFQDTVSRASGADLTADERLELLERGLCDLRQSANAGHSSYAHIQKGAMDAYSEILAVQSSMKDNSLTAAIPTGIAKLDARIFGGGFRAGQLILIGARPGCCKSSLMLNMALNQARLGYTVGIISLEMTRSNLAEIIAQIESNTCFHPFYRDPLSGQDEITLRAGIERVCSLPIWVDDSSRKTVEQVVARAAHMVNIEGCDIVYVDYAQRITYSGKEDSVRELNHISARLTESAKELNIPVVALAQLNRNASTNGAPELKDFKGSGQFEQDAHIALLLHRPNADKDWDKAEPMEIHLAKQRRGVASAFITVEFNRGTQQIY